MDYSFHLFIVNKNIRSRMLDAAKSPILLSSPIHPVAFSTIEAVGDAISARLPLARERSGHNHLHVYNTITFASTQYLILNLCLYTYCTCSPGIRPTCTQYVPLAAQCGPSLTSVVGVGACIL